MTRWRGAMLLLAMILTGCSRSSDGMPEEFPPVRLGMSYEETREALARAHGDVVEQTTGMLRVTGRDRRVAEEVFLFYQGHLAAWTTRYPTPATRGNFMRESKRFTMAFGAPFEAQDEGVVLTTRWRLPDKSGRVLLSGYVAGRGNEAPLMVRVEDPSVVRRLVRSLTADSTATVDTAAAETTGL
jgi:hypothetical protein